MRRPSVNSGFGGHLAALVIPIGGPDRGQCLAGRKLPHDLVVTEQVRVVRRLPLHLLGLLAAPDQVIEHAKERQPTRRTY